MKLSTTDVEQLRATLARARAGSASLTELASAHEKASSAGLASCTAEFREHVRRSVGTSPAPRVGRDLVLGVATGAITHYLLRGL